MTTLTAHFDPLVQPLRGVHAIEASAGTGKTYSITLLWLRLLIEHRLRVDEILVTTFTRAATAELKERLLASLRRALAAAKQVSNDDCPEAKIVTRATPSLGERNLVKELELALSTFDLAPICTIHGFCQSSLVAMRSNSAAIPLWNSPNPPTVFSKNSSATDSCSTQTTAFSSVAKRSESRRWP
jgi:ATP-dependent exoDNAse (exonuclease V) beta subunit